jgi:hypothetical protein
MRAFVLRAVSLPSFGTCGGVYNADAVALEEVVA